MPFCGAITCTVFGFETNLGKKVINFVGYLWGIFERIFERVFGGNLNPSTKRVNLVVIIDRGLCANLNTQYDTHYHHAQR
jgi:hypothetical protein